MRRVVITGIGAVTPIGNDIEMTWNNLTRKVPGVGRITKFDPSGLISGIAGELKNFSPEEYVSKKDILRLDPFVHYASAAALMACKDAGLLQKCPETRDGALRSAGIVIGSSRGGITSMEKALEKHLVHGRPFSAYLMSSSTINMAASHASMRVGSRGPVIGISTACASGTHAAGEALRMIRSGAIQLAIAGGAEAPVCRLAVGGYGASGALSTRSREPHRASRPFDKGRDGFVIAEGAGILVLEELEHAKKRGARMYAELAGYSATSDAAHQTRPDSEGEALAISRALHDAAVAPGEINYINAHATSTPFGDAEEVKAIRKVFGRHAPDIPVSSCKSMLGHMLGAAGAVEAAITALSIYRGTITPTINLDNPDPACELNHITATRKSDIDAAITNSFGFGGVNAVLVLKKFDQKT